MDIEYGASVIDRNGKSLGTVDHIVMDSWSGEPRKFVVRLEDESGAVYFSPEQVAQASGEKVKLNRSIDELEKT